MARFTLYRTQPLVLMWLFCTTAGAQGIKPQVEVSGTPAASSSSLPPVPALAPSAPLNAVPGARPIIYSTGQISPAQHNSQSHAAEAQALMNAFGMALRSMGAGQAGLNYGGYKGRSEIANPSGDEGMSYRSNSGTLTPVSPSDLSGMRKIIPPFQKWFSACTKGLGLGDCRFENMGIMGDAAHRARRSCHNSGEAIDVGTVTCSGGQKITTDSAQFFSLANCMANDSKDELQVIFYKATGPNMIQKSDHNKHMHIQLKNCAMVYGSKS